MSKPTFILSSESLTLHFKGGISKTVLRTDTLFNRILNMLKPINKDTEEDILSTIDPASRLKKHVCGLFDVGNGAIYIDGERCHDLFSKRALEIADLGLPVQPLVNLWKNIKLNTDPVAVKDLYTFLDRRQHPITLDGCFIAYKRVRSDFKDHYSGTFDNSVGQVVAMDRFSVDADSTHTCAPGLHVASLEYARDSYHSGNGILIAVKVNPKDTCAIPPDYQMQKMRVCRYEVIEVMNDISKPIVKPVYNYGIDTQKDAQVDHTIVATVTRHDKKKDASLSKSLDGQLKRSTNDNHKYQLRDVYGHFIRCR